MLYEKRTSVRKNPPDGGFFHQVFHAAAEGHPEQAPSFGQLWGVFGVDDLAYPSVYQPLPLRAKEVWEISF